MLPVPGKKVFAGVLWLMLALIVLVSVPSVSQELTIHRTYVWTHAGRTWTLSYAFPSCIYELQRSATRNLVYSAYGAYVSDSRDDEVLRGLLAAIEGLADGMNVWERLNLVIAFVQSLPYVSEASEYPRYPLETLVDQQGDCEDVAILAAALVREMGFASVLIAFLQERHVGVGIRVLPPHHTTLQAYEWSGDLYYYLEATHPGWEIGQLPPAFHSEPVVIAVPSVVAAYGAW